MARQRPARTDGSFLAPSKIALALVLVVLLTAGAWWLLRSKPVPLSGVGYDLTSALYAACNLEDAKRLDAVVSKLEQQSLATEEREEVMSIVTLAKDGQWQDAAAMARRLLESQDRR